MTPRFSVRAKIDFIRLDRVGPFKDYSPTLGLIQRFFEGSVNIPKRQSQDWLTVHDPTVADLQTLIDNFPQHRIGGLEISLDFTPAGGDAVGLYRWLRHRVHPYKHVLITGVRRRQYCVGKRRYERIRGLRAHGAATTLLWSAPRNGLQVRLYIKEHDRAGELMLEDPVVRLEVTMDHLALQMAYVPKVGMLPMFVHELRRYFGPALYVARGLRPSLTRVDRLKDPKRKQRMELQNRRELARNLKAWERYGATYAVDREVSVIPDRVVNSQIGIALKQLQQRLGALKPPRKVADYDAYLSEQSKLLQLLELELLPTYRTGTA